MKGQDLYAKAKRLIPGGTQLLSKRPELFLPEGWPSYYGSARGVEVTDLEGKTYLDMSLMGVGAAILGYGDPEVDAAVKDAIDRGVNSTLNPPEEVELAELLCNLHPWADMARFARTGGEAMAIAVRIARAHTNREKIVFCGYHGWTDWYLAANLGDTDALDGQLMPGLDPAGVPRSLRGTALPFHYNHLGEFKKAVEACGSDLAAVVMEPQRGEQPEPGFLEEVRDLSRRKGAVLVFDEITTGFRMTSGGIHLLHGIDPDIAVFAKGMANGYAMAAVIGRSEVMEAARQTFISSTNWTERIGPVAALTTIRKHQRDKVADHLIAIGSLVKRGWRACAEKAGLSVRTPGLPSLPEFHLDGLETPLWRTQFTHRMLNQGFLAYNQFKPSFAHTRRHVELYLEEAENVFAALASGSALPKDAARAEDGFYRLT